MTRTEAIAIINANLPALDDIAVADLAGLVQASASAQGFVLRDLTDDERAGIERSREDFKAGRTLTSAEYRADMADFMAKLKTKYPSGP